MKSPLKFLVPCLAWPVLAATIATTSTREETLVLTDNRKMSVEVPESFDFESRRDRRGVISLRMNAPPERVSVMITLLPDAQNVFADSWTRKESLHESFKDYVANSVEKAMQFQELEPAVGEGTYCVFTDVNLVGKEKYPPGEYLHATKGVKALPGIVAIFEIFSNDTTSEAYRAILRMLRESVEEVPVPLR